MGALIRPGKLNAGSVEYYEQNVTRQPLSVGTDMSDYYSEHGDRPPQVLVFGRDGERVAESCERLGVQPGQVLEREQVETWFNEGRGPVTGEQLGRAYVAPSERRVAVRDEQGQPVLDQWGDPVTRTERSGGSVRGWDLMTAAPKSVSMLWALGDEQTREVVERAHREASEASLGYLAAHAGYTRQRMPGFDEPVVIESGALVGVRYEHRTSRAMEPHLHDHVLVHNRVLNPVTGGWTSLDGTSVMHECKTAGVVYQATLRARLSQDLGVSWQQVDPHSGVADLRGLDRATVEAWSSRTSEIQAWMDARGLAGAAADAAAQKETREAKDTSHTDDQLRAMWADRARSEGIDVASIGRGPGDQEQGQGWALPTSRQVLAEASRERSTFTRSHVVAAAAALLPPSLVPADQVRATAEEVADLALRHAVRLHSQEEAGDDVSVRLRDGRLFGTREGSVRYATPETLQVEAETVARAGARIPDFATVEPLVAASVGGELSLDQVAAVRSLVCSDRQVSVLIAPAGAGKTTSLRHARDAWERVGARVHGVAPTGKAAAGLVDEQAAQDASTIATVLGRVRRGEGPGWAPGDVVLVDEAGMVGSLTLAALVEQAARVQAKLVLIGDPEQLQPVGEAAGMFELLADDLPDTARLGEVWRQQDEQERQATLGLRGDADQIEQGRAIAWYMDHDRVQAGDTSTMLSEAFARWAQATEAGQRAVMLAPTWEVAEALAATAQEHQVRAGVVDHSHTVRVGEADEQGRLLGRGQVAGVGDLVMTRKNDYTLRTSTGGTVKNGQTWQVTGISGDPDRARVDLTRTGTDAQERVQVPASYLAEHARLAYGVSIHQAQGVTTDVGVCVLDGSTSAQNTLYTAMTRGRVANHAFIAAAPDTSDHDHQDRSAHRFRSSRDETWDLLEGILTRNRRDVAAHQVLSAEQAAGRARAVGRYGSEAADDFAARARRTDDPATRAHAERVRRAEEARRATRPPPGQRHPRMGR